MNLAAVVVDLDSREQRRLEMPSRILYDLTTSARRPGAQSGIVRVERSLGKFAPDVAQSPMEYSVYDVQSKDFLVLKPEVATRILDGDVRVRFSRASRPTQSRVGWLPKAQWVARNPRRYLRHRLGWAPNSLISARANSLAHVTSSGPEVLNLEDCVEGSASICASDVLITCGAGWHGMDLSGIYALKRDRGFFYVAVCYDVIPWQYPHFWRAGVAQSVVDYYAETAWLSNAILCISKATAREFADFCSDLDLVCPPLNTFRLGDQPPGVTPRTPMRLEDDRFILMVGSIEPRKNHRLLYDVWDELCRDGSFPSDVKLVIAGADQWMTDDLLTEISLNRWVRDRIVILQRVSDAELGGLYESCLFTTVPSLHEGWGLPAAESLSFGKVPITSNRGSLAEISALTVRLDVRDFRGWRETIRRYVMDDDHRSKHEERIRTEFEPQTWLDSATEFFGKVAAMHSPSL